MSVKKGRCENLCSEPEFMGVVCGLRGAYLLERFLQRIYHGCADGITPDVHGGSAAV